MARLRRSQEEAVVDQRLGRDVPLAELAPREAHGEVDEVGGEDGDEGVLEDHVEGAVGEHREYDEVVLAPGEQQLLEAAGGVLEEDGLA